MQLIIKHDAKSPISEAYRTIRTNIQFTALDAKEKVLLVTSAGMSEGKSTTTSNLAFALAESDKKVLLIDCDMRRPALHKVFKISNMQGLSNYLIGQVDLQQVLQHAEENLHILTSGTIPPNPSELLGSNKMKSFIEQVKEQYDYVLIDTPPVIAVTDAQIMSTLCNGVIMVVASGKAQREAVKRSKELLEAVGAKILGAVLTCIDIKSRSKYQYYYYYSNEPKNKRSKRKR